MTETLPAALMLKAQQLIAGLSWGVTNFRHPIRAARLAKARRIWADIPTATTPLECVELAGFVSAAEKIPGDMAEAGVFNGGSAAIMLDSSGKRLHLFDTFEGLPETEGKYVKGEYAGSIESVRRNLGKWGPRLVFHPGCFPQSTAGLDDLRFSFVHLDLDLYEGTKSALEWFWPRLKAGGVIVSHDYPSSPGVVRAFQEFFDDSHIPVFPLTGMQCAVVKAI